MREIVIIGAGGHAREQLGLIAAINATFEVDAERFTVLGFLVDRRFKEAGQTVCDLPVLGDIDWLKDRTSNVEVLCAIGSPSARQRLASGAAAHGARFPTFVHPCANVGQRVALGPGVIVGSGAVITCDVEIGAHAHINVGATVSHDCRLGDFATLAPGVHAAGGVCVEEGTEIGVGATISDRVTIGGWTILGAGAVAVHDVPPNCTAVGVPARVIEQRDPGWQLGSDTAGPDDSQA
jgi:sugar O-acyltransferase (sialic acid O-acetyltransferase NeuD family)